MKNEEYWLLRRFLKYSSPFTSVYSYFQEKKYKNINVPAAPVFIIGAPRSGSTILYQTITNFCDVTYIDNLTYLSRENILFGFFLSHFFFDDRPHNSFYSMYGKTKGLHAPSEAGSYWYRYFPKNRPDIDVHDIEPKKAKRFVKDLNLVIKKYNKAYVIKNLYFVERLRILRKIVPEARYIVIKRDIIENILSLLRSRDKAGDRNAWWSVKPRCIDNVEIHSVLEEIAAQVLLINQQIKKDLTGYPPEKIYEVKYENFIRSPQKIINEIISFIGTKKKVLASFEEFNLDKGSSPPLSEREIAETRMAVETVLKRIDNG